MLTDCRQPRQHGEFCIKCISDGRAWHLGHVCPVACLPPTEWYHKQVNNGSHVVVFTQRSMSEMLRRKTTGSMKQWRSNQLPIISKPETRYYQRPSQVAVLSTRRRWVWWTVKLGNEWTKIKQNKRKTKQNRKQIKIVTNQIELSKRLITVRKQTSTIPK